MSPAPPGVRPLPHLLHLTLDTGHRRRSAAEEVDDAVRARLAPVLARALEMGEPQALAPGWPYRLRLSAEGRSALLATLEDAAGTPVLAFGVARTSRAGAGLWPTLAAGRAAAPPPPAPWLAVRLLPGASDAPPDDLAAMGDMERTVAWTWLRMHA